MLSMITRRLLECSKNFDADEKGMHSDAHRYDVRLNRSGVQFNPLVSGVCFRTGTQSPRELRAFLELRWTARRLWDMNNRYSAKSGGKPHRWLRANSNKPDQLHADPPSFRYERLRMEWPCDGFMPVPAFRIPIQKLVQRESESGRDGVLGGFPSCRTIWNRSCRVVSR
jgi:hypothetical protein